MDKPVEHNVLIVFAGGPHTGSRLEQALERAQAQPSATVFLTGCEFHAPEHRPAIHVLSGLTRVGFDEARSTVQSCRDLSRQIEPSSTVRVITSNYHAPRVRWLLRAYLPQDTVLHVDTTPDIQFGDLVHSSLARKLVLGEVLSWLYCFPLGLLHVCRRR